MRNSTKLTVRKAARRSLYKQCGFLANPAQWWKSVGPSLARETPASNTSLYRGHLTQTSLERSRSGLSSSTEKILSPNVNWRGPIRQSWGLLWSRCKAYLYAATPYAKNNRTLRLPTPRSGLTRPAVPAPFGCSLASWRRRGVHTLHPVARRRSLTVMLPRPRSWHGLRTPGR